MAVESGLEVDDGLTLVAQGVRRKICKEEKDRENQPENILLGLQFSSNIHLPEGLIVQHCPPLYRERLEEEWWYTCSCTHPC
ncbi:hypothetical protein MHYP_G00191620 [Metynnis hypsauchen]